MAQFCNDKNGHDKKLHLFISFVIAGVLGPILAHIPPHNPWIVSVCVFVFTMLVGLGKEIYDRYKGGHFCVWDLLADVVGAFGGTVLTWFAAYFLSAGNLL